MLKASLSHISVGTGGFDCGLTLPQFLQLHMSRRTNGIPRSQRI